MEAHTNEISNKGSGPPYEKRVVALVDFLGWKDLIDQHPEAPPELACRAVNRLQLELSAQAEAQGSGRKIPGADFQIFSLNVKDEYTNDGLSSSVPNEGDFQLNQFSDHLLMSCRPEGIAPIMLIDRLSNLMWSTFASGLFIRGAVVVGEMLHTTTAAFGPALNRAHTVESTLAVYPRVIVDDRLEEVVNYATSEVRDSASGSQPLCRDRDGLLFIDFVRRRFLFGQEVDKRDIWQGIRDRLVERRRRHAKEPRVLANDNWMITYFNEVVRQAPQLASLEIAWEASAQIP